MMALLEMTRATQFDLTNSYCFLGQCGHLFCQQHSDLWKRTTASYKLVFMLQSRQGMTECNCFCSNGLYCVVGKDFSWRDVTHTSTHPR